MIVAAAAFALMQATAVLTGTVLTDSTERPIANAEVSISSLGLTTRSDSAGRFMLAKIPRGAQEITVRAVGYAAIVTQLTFANAQRIRVNLLMERAIVAASAQALKRIYVKARSPSGDNPRIAEFDERMKFGIGTFITQPTFERNEGRAFAEVLIARIAGVRTAGANSRSLVSTRGVISFTRQACFVRVVLDGIVQNLEGGFNIDAIDLSTVAAVEYYTLSESPLQFNFAGSGACGTLVIWTRYRVK